MEGNVGADGWDRGCRWLALLILPDQDIDGVFTRKKVSDREPLVDASPLECDSVVGVDLKYRVRTDSN
jgi:hypothetical protein